MLRLARNRPVQVPPDQLRVAVVGTGFIAGQHLACLQTIPRADVVAVCDLSETLARATAERFSISAHFTDHTALLASVRPDVVHITTPPPTHLPIALDCLAAGAHLVVEKPVTATYRQWQMLRDHAESIGRSLLVNHNYCLDPHVLRLRAMVDSGSFGAVTEVSVRFFQAITDPGHPFADPYLPHPTLSLPGGAVSDFLPHLASLAHLFLGPHHHVISSWWRADGQGPLSRMTALVEARQGVATLAFDANARPEGFWLRVYAERAQAQVNFYDGRCTVEPLRDGPPAVARLRNALEEGRTLQRQALTSFWEKLSGGPGTYAGLWELLRRYYATLGTGAAPPITVQAVDDVMRLVDELVAGAPAA